MRRALKRVLLLLAAVLLLAMVGAWLALAGSLAQLDGERALAGLDGEVEVARDALGVVDIRAGSEADAMRALGFVHAQERYFEMDLMRRAAAGELAELFGAPALGHDRRVRVHQMRSRVAGWIGDESRERLALIEAYADGVNAGLEALRVRPWPYLLLREQPRPWSIEDSFLVAAAMFFDLQDEDNRRELGLLQLREHLPAPVFQALRLVGTPWDAPLMGEARGLPELPAELVELLAEDSGPQLASLELPSEHAPGSNSFAVAAGRSRDGVALVASDMHLGHGVPNIWFRARLAMPGPDGGMRSLAGLTLPGVPGLVAGSNGEVAWAFTNSYGDWLDWIELRWIDREALRYATADGAATAKRVIETISVRGGADEELEILLSEWGPVLHERDGGALALAWTAHRPGAINLGLLDINRARDLDQALDAARRFGMPAQNFVAGDRHGRIGWTLTGAVPRRVGSCDPLLPLDPYAGCGWDGWVEPDRVPALVDPPGQALWTANARIVDGAALALVGDGGYALGARQKQIRDQLLAGGPFDAETLLALQLDDRALFLEPWWRRLREALVDDDGQLSTIEALTREWSPRASVDAVAYRLVRGVREAVHQRIYQRLVAPARAALGEAFVPPRLPQLEGLVWAALHSPQLAAAGFDGDQLLRKSAAEVLAELQALPGGPTAARWGERNRARIAHPLAGALPWPLSAALRMPDDPLPGDQHMPRVQAPSFGASQRFVVSPGHEPDGVMHMPGGQSGHPLSPGFGAGHQDWVAGAATPFLPGPQVHRLLLRPPGQ